MANIDLNVSPYFDDFDPNKDFLRVLFRPGFPVQARELTTLQSIMQEQIKRFGDHVFKQGSRVTGARINFDKSSYRLLLSGNVNATFPASGARQTATLANIEDFIGLTISNTDGTAKATVMSSPQGIDTKLNTGQIFLKYITTKQFDTTGGYIYATVADNPDLSAELYNTFSEKTVCSLAHIEEGVFYVSDFFTRVAAQTIIVSAESIIPSVKLGFTVETSLVEPSTDNTLFDNARGSTNEGAPGAHRLTNTLKFSIRSLDEKTDANFFNVLTIENGIVQTKPTQNPIYDELGKTLARRTYDESGDYSVDPLELDVFNSDSEQKFIVSYDAGKAYVRGNEIEFLSRTNIRNDKPLSFEKITNRTLSITGVPKVKVTVENNSTLPGFDAGDPHLHTNRIHLQDSDNQTIGVARAWAFEDSPSGKDYLHLYDIKMLQNLNLDNSFDPGQGGDVKSTSDTHGFVYKLENTGDLNVDWDSDTRIAVIDYNRPFKVGQTISSTVKSSASAEIVSATTYKFADVKQIRGASGNFHAEINTTDNLENGNSSLYGSLGETLKTTREGSNVFDNNFEVLYANPPTIVGTQGGVSITPKDTDTIFTQAAPNGDFDRTQIDDADEITKTLKFVYMKVRNPGSSRSSSINYGWTTQDKHITLLYPDVHRVYQINNGSTNNEFAHFTEINITVTGGGAIPQGSIITGKNSGTKAIVALTNGAQQEAELTGTAGYHTSRKGTGNDSVVEIIYTKGNEFQVGETLMVETPADQAAFNNVVTYDSTRGTVITNTSESFGQNVTNDYFLDNGQREHFYDVGRVERKNNVSAPASGDLTIFYSYFDADPTNKFFYSVDSYESVDFFGEDVRKFKNKQEISKYDPLNGENQRDYIDFRLRAAVNNNTGQNTLTFAHRTFKNQSHLLPGSAVTSSNPQSTFTFDYERYLPRIDSIFLNELGNIVIAKGEPSVTPYAPKPIKNAMHLNDIFLPAAFRNAPREININSIDNRRFTMRDIGDIEQRIDRLEDAVSLSLLESQALHDNIDDRTKLGFIVDDFNSLDGSISDPVLTSAFTSETDRTLRPAAHMNTLRAEVTNSTSLSSNNIDPYYYSQGFITKKYTEYPASNEPEWLTQSQASSSIKINPYATWIYQGRITLTPSEDIFHDANRRVITGFVIDRAGTVNDSDVTAAEFNRQVQPRNTGEPFWGSWANSGGVFRNRGRWNQRQVRDRLQNQITTIDSAARFETRNVVEDSQAFVRSQDITVSIHGMRPNTTLKATFNGEDVTSLIVPAANHDAVAPIFTGTAGNLVTSANGNLEAKFTVPSSRFPTGSIPFVFSGTDTNDEGFTTTAEAIFTAKTTFDVGVLTRFRTERQTQTTVGSDDRTVDRGRAGDPIAQTFTLPILGVGSESAFVTSVDIFMDYVDTRPQMDTVIVEVRNVVNGYPGKEVIGTAEKTVTNSMGSTNASVATNFKFDSPVFLEGGKEYCLVVLSPSPLTSCWTAVQGELDITSGTGGLISSQPNVGGYFGSFFKSQNNSTWTADQNRDLKFKLYKAKFNTADSTLKVSSVLDNQFYSVNPVLNGDVFETFKHSNYVLVRVPDHGMYGPNNKVVVFNASGLSNKIGGIPVSEINSSYTVTNGLPVFTSSHTVYFPTKDSFFIKTDTRATENTKGGGSAMISTNTQFDAIKMNVPSVVYSDTSISAKMKTTSGTTLDHVIKSQIIATDTNDENYTATGIKGDFENIEINELHYFDKPKIVQSATNTSTKGIDAEVRLISNNPDHSPVIKMWDNNTNEFFNFETHRNSIGNLVDDSDISEFYPTFTAKFAADSDLLEQSDSDNDTKLRQFSSYVASSISANEQSDFVTRIVKLDTPADTIDIKFDADMNPSNEIEIAFKAKRIGDNADIDDQAWEDFKLDTFINEENYEKFSSNEDFKQYSATHSVGEFYNELRVRIRLRTKNEAQPPRVRNLRIIANA